MGFDDLFEDKRRHHGSYSEHAHHRSHDDHNYNRYSHEQRYPSHGRDGHLKLLAILNRVRNDRKLKLIAITVVIVLLIIAVAVIIALLPLIIQLINYISQNGVQGLFDSVTGFLDKLWKGSGK